MKKLFVLLSISIAPIVYGAEQDPLLVEADRFTTDVPINSVCFHPDGVRLAAGLKIKKIPVWDIVTKTLKEELEPASPDAPHIAWNSQGERLAISANQAIELINTNNKNSVLIQNSIISKIPIGVVTYSIFSNPSWSPDGSLLGWGSFQKRGNNFVSIWDVERQQILHTLPTTKSYVAAVSFHPTDPCIASGSLNRNTVNQGTIYIWDTRSGQHVQEFGGHGYGYPFALDWNGNGYQLAAASSSKNIHMFDTRNDQCLQLAGHAAHIYTVKWHPDRIRLASGSADQTVRLWNAQNKTCLQELPVDTSTPDPYEDIPRQPGVFSVDWSPDGSQLATGSADGIVRIFRDPKENNPGTGDQDPGGGDPDPKDEEEKFAQTVLAVADTKGISMLALYKSNTLKKEGRVETPQVRSISYNPLTLKLTALKDNGSDFIAHHPSGKLLTVASIHDQKPSLALYRINKNDFEHIDTFSELPSLCNITYNASGDYLAATSSTNNTVTTFLFDDGLQFQRVGSFPTGGLESRCSAYHPKKQLLATANAASNTVSMFTGDAFGQLMIRGNFRSGGKKPIFLSFDPYGDSLAVLHEESNDIILLTPGASTLLPLLRYQLDSPVSDKFQNNPLPVALAFRPLKKQTENDQSARCITDTHTFERLRFLKYIARQKLKEEAHAQLEEWIAKQDHDSLQASLKYAIHNRNKHDVNSYDYMAWDEIASKIKIYR